MKMIRKFFARLFCKKSAEIPENINLLWNVSYIDADGKATTRLVAAVSKVDAMRFVEILYNGIVKDAVKHEEVNNGNF